MSSYTIMPEGCRWTDCSYEQDYDAEIIYRMHAHWYKPSTRIAIRNNSTGQTWIYTRQIDEQGQAIVIGQL